MNTRICNNCNILKSNSQYRLYSNGNTGTICKACLNEQDKLRKQILRDKKSQVLTLCEICDKEKPLFQFTKLKKFYKRKICFECYPGFLKQQKNEWCKNEHNTNMNYRLKKSLAARLRNVLDKKQTTMDYIGCNIQYLREWFEYNFTDEMSWDNYGTYWSIVHIIPVNKFDLTDENEKFKCWNWSNMMPLSIKENSSKKQCINLSQVENIINKLEKFKEEGSTTKWFSEEYILTKELALQKQNNINSS